MDSPSMQTPDNIVPFVDGQPGAGPGETEGANGQGWIDAVKNMKVPEQHADTAPIPEENAQGNSPTVIQPLQHSGLRGMIDHALDSLAGTHGVKLAQDQDGQMYINHPNLTRGQQWVKIGALALRSAGAGLAAGKGAGNKGKALEAGFQVADQQAQQQDQKEKDYQTQVANSQALTHQLAAQALRDTREGIKFDRGTADYYNKQYDDALAIQGTQDLGHVSNLSELAQLMKKSPDAVKAMVSDGDLRVIPAYDYNGNATGFHAIQMPPKYGDTQLPAGSAFNIAVADPDKPGYMKLQPQIASTPMTQRQQQSYNDAATRAVNDAYVTAEKAKTAEDQKKAQTASENATASEAPSKIRENNANADAAEARANATKTGELLPDGTKNPAFQAMVDATYSGDILPADVKRQAKGMGLDPNAILAGAVLKGQQAGNKPFSETIIKEENDYAKNVKVQAAIDGIDRIIKPGGGYMDIMLNAAKRAGLTDSGAANSLILSGKRAWGDTNAKNLETAIGETRRSIAGLIGNPLLGGGDSDKKLEQARDMLGKAPTMKNLQGAADLLNQALRTQRASMVDNNRFLVKRYGATQAQPAAQAAPKPAAAATQPQIVQQSPSTGLYRYSTDGGKTWISGKPPQQ